MQNKKIKVKKVKEIIKTKEIIIKVERDNIFLYI